MESRKEEEWRSMADTHKMSPEEVKRTGVDQSKRPPGHGGAGAVLHQTRRLPFSFTTIAAAGVAISGAVWYFTLYVKKKPEASAVDVAKVAAGGGGPESTHPRK